MGDSKPKFDGLDLIRFAAAAMVMWYHLAWWSWYNPNSVIPVPIRFPKLTSTATFGGVGVEIFFVISGFFIALTSDGKGAGAFLKSRFLRLYPPVWICATLSVLALWTYSSLDGGQLARAWVRSAILWPMGNRVDGVYWTLGVEMMFYAMVLLLIVAGQWKRFGLFLIALGVPGSLFVLSSLAGADLSWFYSSQLAQLTLLRHGFLFALGGIMWMAWAGRASWIHMAFGVLFLIVGALSVYASPIKAPITATVVWLVAVAAMAASARWHGRINISWARQAGLATYPLYLLHNVCGLALMRGLVEDGLPPYAALFATMALIVTASFAILGPTDALTDLTKKALGWRPAPKREPAALA